VHEENATCWGSKVLGMSVTVANYLADPFPLLGVMR